MTDTPFIQAFFDEATSTVSYILADPAAREAAVIDPVLDYDQKSGRLGAKSASAICDAALGQGFKITWILETHAHADHLTAAQFIKARTGARVAIGAHIGAVQEVFRKLFNIPGVSISGTEFDRRLNDREVLKIGGLNVEVLHTPGHTAACVSYKAANAVFVGDTIFMPDYGTARTDFPGGDASTLYRSIRRILSLPPETRLFMCHDYKAPGRDHHAWETTVAEQRAQNIHIRDGVSEAEYVALRNARDGGLEAPALLLPSIQVNIRAGRLPAPESNGTRYLKIPLRLEPDLSGLTG